VAVVLTLVQTKLIRINIHKRNNTKNAVKAMQNTVNTRIYVYICTYIYICINILPKHPHITKPTHTQTHTHNHTLQNKLKQPHTS
jgi:amino acid permease